MHNEVIKRDADPLEAWKQTVVTLISRVEMHTERILISQFNYSYSLQIVCAALMQAAHLLPRTSTVT